MTYTPTTEFRFNGQTVDLISQGVLGDYNINVIVHSGPEDTLETPVLHVSYFYGKVYCAIFTPDQPEQVLPRKDLINPRYVCHPELDQKIFLNTVQTWRPGKTTLADVVKSLI
ncbi:MAG: hypothetical protein WC254_07150 [Candidatus Woesearchaeota archaeon]|jgi:hypothetical protein